MLYLSYRQNKLYRPNYSNAATLMVNLNPRHDNKTSPYFYAFTSVNMFKGSAHPHATKDCLVETNGHAYFFSIRPPIHA